MPSSHRSFLGLAEGFSLLTEPARKLLAGHAVVHNLKKGMELVKRGQRAPSVFALRSGVLALAHRSSNSAEVVTDFFANRSLVLLGLENTEISGYSLRSVGTGAAVSWPGAVMATAMRQSPDFHFWVTSELLSRQRQIYFMRGRMNGIPLDVKLVYFFWSMSEKLPDGRRFFNGRIAQELLASYFLVTREEINRRIILLEKTGYYERTSSGAEPAGIFWSEACPTLFYLYTDMSTPWDNPYPQALAEDSD